MTIVAPVQSRPAVDRQREQQLLICCTRTAPDRQVSARISSLLSADLDWPYVLQTAAQHRILPLVHRTLIACGPDALPAEVRRALQSYVQVAMQRNLFLMHELIKILRLFAAEGIVAVPYKGPVLATTVYGDLALREFIDLDILIHQRDMAQARGLLLALGFEPYDHPTYASEFTRDNGNIRVEIHHEAIGFASSWQNTLSYCAFPLDLDQLAERLQTITLGGMPAQHFAPEDLLLVLCVHGSKHLWERLSWICDVAETLRVHSAVNWNALFARAAQFGSVRMLLLGLSLAHYLLEAPLPEDIRRRIQADTVVLALTAQLSAQLFDERDEVSAVAREIAVSLRMREHARDRLALLAHYGNILFFSGVKPSAKDQAFLALPRPLGFVAYLLRPLRLLGEHGLKPVVAPGKAPEVQSGQ